MPHVSAVLLGLSPAAHCYRLSGDHSTPGSVSRGISMKQYAFLFAGLLCAGTVRPSALAQQPLKTGVDATFAPHAMPRLGGGSRGSTSTSATRSPSGWGAHRDRGDPVLRPRAGLNAGKYDFILAPTTLTEERAQGDALHRRLPGHRLHVRPEEGGQADRGPGGDEGDDVSVNKGSAYESWAKANADKYGFKYDIYDTNADAVQAVISGRADANLAGNTVSQWAAKQNNQVKTSYRIKTGLVWAIPFRKDDVAGAQRGVDGHQVHEVDGTLAKLHEKWFGEKPAPDSSTATDRARARPTRHARATTAPPSRRSADADPRHRRPCTSRTERTAFSRAST